LHRIIANKTEIPPLPWDEIKLEEFEQGKLF